VRFILRNVQAEERKCLSQPARSLERQSADPDWSPLCGSPAMNDVIYLVGLIVVVMLILSFFGLR
jgi:hypothetical protein